MIRTIKLVLALISLLIGSLIYILWRPETLIIFAWFDNIGATNIITSLRKTIGVFPPFLPLWMLYSFPNALWVFTGIFILGCIWEKNLARGSVFWIGVFLLIAFGSEIGQFLRIVPGVFCWGDMTTMGIAALVGIFAIMKTKNREIPHA